VGIIRQFKKTDRQAIREIAWQTAFMGESAEIFFTDKEIFADALTSYFTDYEPQSCFVAEVGKEVVGYLLGTLDQRRLNRIFKKKILTKLFLKSIARLVFFDKKNLRLFWNCFLSFLKGEFRQPDFSSKYPALLHINIKKEFRHRHIGSSLIEAFLKYLKKEGSKGVCLATFSDAAGKFFSAQGFSLIYSCQRSYFYHILKKKINVYIYARQISNEDLR